MDSNIVQRLQKCISLALPKALKTAWWLIRITVPVTFIVFVLNYTGILQSISAFVNPFFKHLGLPGETAFVLITSVFTNIYSVVAVLGTLALSVRESIILALMCLISHAFIIETAVLHKTGSSSVRMTALRLVTSLVGGILLNFILPEFPERINATMALTHGTFTSELLSWSVSMLYLCGKIMVLISALLILQKILEEFGVIQWLSKLLKPILSLLGLSESASLSWLVANIVGLSYGSAIIMEQVDENKISKEDADLLNHHIAISHSQLEDPLLFLAIGLPISWLIWPRIALAIVAVWLRKLELKIRGKGKQ